MKSISLKKKLKNSFIILSLLIFMVKCNHGTKPPRDLELQQEIIKYNNMVMLILDKMELKITDTIYYFKEITIHFNCNTDSSKYKTISFDTNKIKIHDLKILDYMHSSLNIKPKPDILKGSCITVYLNNLIELSCVLDSRNYTKDSIKLTVNYE